MMKGILRGLLPLTVVAGCSDRSSAPEPGSVAGGGSGTRPSPSAGTGANGGSMAAAGASATSGQAGQAASGSGGVAGAAGTGGSSAIGGAAAAAGAGAAAIAGAGAGATAGTGVGGMPSGGHAGAPPVSNGEGQIRITDTVPGWASQGGGTTGGGTDLGAAVSVTTMSDLQKHASGTDPKIILVEPGEYKGTLMIGANKTIIGTRPGVVIKGYVEMRADKADSGGVNMETHNIIIRNLAVQGDPCNDLTLCRQGPDAIYMGGGAHHIWLDHLDVSDGQDGNCDATRGSDYMTVSWSKFHYTYDKPHRFSNLIAGADDETESKGKLKITYMKSWWGDRVEQRQPRGRFGDVHVFNTLHNGKANEDNKQYAIGPGVDMAVIVENSVFDMAPESKAMKIHSYGAWRGILARGNIGHTKNDFDYPMNYEGGTVFKIPYEYDLIPADQVEAVLTNPVCGAGNTCTLAR